MDLMRSSSHDQTRLPFTPPERVRSEVERFCAKFPFENNVFVMMPYDTAPEIYQTLRSTLESYSLVPHLAEHRILEPQLWSNVEIYIWSCALGLALLPLSSSLAEPSKASPSSLNENVLIETGYMLALERRVLLLKDDRIDRLPTDIANLIHRDYCARTLPFSMTEQIMFWCEDDLDLFGEASFRDTVHASGRERLVYLGGSCDWEPYREPVQDLARRIGDGLVSSNFYVVGGANYVGVSAIVGAWARMEDAPQHRYRERARHVAMLDYGHRGEALLLEADIDPSRIRYVPHTMDRPRYSRFAVHECDAILLLHGRNGTSDEFDCAVERARIVIPMGATGGRARELYDEIRAQRRQVTRCDITDEEWITLGNDDALQSDEGREELATTIVRILSRERRAARIARRAPRSPDNYGQESPPESGG